jgi:replicative DNA helicase
MVMNGHQSAYSSAADDTLAAMYFDPAKIDQAIYDHTIKGVYYPFEPQRVLFQTLCELRLAGQEVYDTTVLAKAGNRLTHEWLLNLVNTYAPPMGVAFDSNCRLLVEYGTRANALKVLQVAQDQMADASGKPTADIIRQTVDVLGGLHTASGIRNVTASDTAIDFSEYMKGEPATTQSTGLDWLDDLTGGFSPADIWWLVSAYKMRKTTLLLNLGLHAALNGASVAFLSREMPKRRVVAQIVCMLGIGYLIEHGFYETKTSAGHPLNWINPRALMQARSTYRRWDNRKVAAIDYGIAEWHKVKNMMRIYDTSDEGGRLSDMNSAEAVIRRDRVMYGTQIVMADYLQLFDAPGAGIFDKTSYAARLFQEIGKRDDLTMIIAAQKNENSIQNMGQESYSSGVKGGGDPAQTADFLLETRYKYGDLMDERKLEVTLKLSRHGSGGNNTKNIFDIHPGSGLFLEGEYARERRNSYQTESVANLL